MSEIQDIQLDENGLRKTPLYDYYVEKGVKLVDFGGWALPIQFSSIQEEHEAVRNSVGLFDASHMGEVRVTGDDVIGFLDTVLSNDLTKVADGQAIYNAVTNEEGYTLDDLIIYKNSDQDVMVTPNSSNYEKIFNWLQKHNDGSVEIVDETAEWGLIAIQGPDAEEVLAKVTDADLPSIKGYHFSADETVAGVEGVVVSRTGYTGEDGFELYIPWNETRSIWEKLLEVGADKNITECALGSRDTLRLEGGMALYGNDLSEEINPLEGGIAFAVKTGDKKEVDYPGKAALEAYKELPASERRVSKGFELEGKGIARQGYEVYSTDGETKIGEVTSGTKSPTFGKAIGYVMINKEYADNNDEVLIQIRKNQVPAKLVAKNWLRR